MLEINRLESIDTTTTVVNSTVVNFSQPQAFVPTRLSFTIY